MDGFDNWVRDFRAKAFRRGISASTFEHAFQNTQFSEDVLEQDLNQPEYTQTIWDYLDRAVTEIRVQNGRARHQRERARL